MQPHSLPLYPPPYSSTNRCECERVFGGVGRGLFHRAAVALSLSTDNGYIKDYRLKIISNLIPT